MVINRRTIRIAVALLTAAFALTGKLAVADLLLYYPFDSSADDGMGSVTTPDLSGNGNNAAVVQGTGAGNTVSVASPPTMFGAGALQLTNTTSGGSGSAGRAQLPANNADVDRTYTNFSVSTWLQPDSWADFPVSGSGTAERLIAGKHAGNPNRGWVLSKLTAAANGSNQLQFAYWDGPNTSGTDNVQTWRLAFDTTPSASEFMHVAVAFRANDGMSDPGFVGIYVNGILQNATLVNGSPTVLTQLNGDNGLTFQVGSRGDGPNGTSGGWRGSIDDFALWDETLTDQGFALIHGLGRLVDVSLSPEIEDVMDAYDTLGSAAAGGFTWDYTSSVGDPGDPIGTIGGSGTPVDPYFIVLGSDGSGVSAIPEPTSYVLVLLSLSGLALCRRASRKA